MDIPVWALLTPSPPLSGCQHCTDQGCPPHFSFPKTSANKAPTSGTCNTSPAQRPSSTVRHVVAHLDLDRSADHRPIAVHRRRALVARMQASSDSEEKTLASMSQITRGFLHDTKQNKTWADMIIHTRAGISSQAGGAALQTHGDHAVCSPCKLVKVKASGPRSARAQTACSTALLRRSVGLHDAQHSRTAAVQNVLPVPDASPCVTIWCSSGMAGGGARTAAATQLAPAAALLTGSCCACSCRT